MHEDVIEKVNDSIENLAIVISAVSIFIVIIMSVFFYSINNNQTELYEKLTTCQDSINVLIGK